MSHVISQINNAISSGNGSTVANFFKISHLMAQKDQCLVCSKEVHLLKSRPANWQKIFLHLLSVPLAATAEEAYKHFTQATAIFYSSLSDFDNQLKIPIVKEISHTYRQLAESHDFNACLQQLRLLLPLSMKIKDEPYSIEGSPILAVTNDLICLFLALNDFKQANTLFQQKCDEIIKRIPDKSFTTSELCTFYFNGGKIYTVLGYQQDAIKYLTKALSYAPMTQAADRRLIYSFLVPNQMSIGCMPSNELLEKYDLAIYKEIADAMIKADLVSFDQAVEEKTLTLIRLGVWDVITKAKKIIYRRLLEAVCNEVINNQNDRKVDLRYFHEAISLQQKHTIDEAETILAGLISDGFCRAYVSDAMKKIVFDKNAFPTLPLAKK